MWVGQSMKPLPLPLPLPACRGEYTLNQGSFGQSDLELSSSGGPQLNIEQSWISNGTLNRSGRILPGGYQVVAFEEVHQEGYLYPFIQIRHPLVYHLQVPCLRYFVLRKVRTYVRCRARLGHSILILHRSSSCSGQPPHVVDLFLSLMMLGMIASIPRH